MKNKLRFLGYIAIVAIITLTLASCDIMKLINELSGTPADTPADNPSGPSGIYTGMINDAAYTLTVYPASAKAAHAIGDNFTLTVTRANTEKISSGKLVGITGSQLSAQPFYIDAPVFIISVSGTQITEISNDNITFNDGSTEKGPGSFSSGGNPGNVAVTGVTLAPATLNLTLGGSPSTLSATVKPASAANKNVTWTSSNTSVATVNNGVVTAVAAGNATITVTTVDGGKTATCAVTVNPFAVTLNSVSANGSSSQTTTQLTLAFSKAITGLSADNITLSGVTGVTKGTLSGSGPSYALPISGFTSGGTLSVTVSSPTGYSISGSPKSTTIYYYVTTQTGSGTATLTITFAQISDAAPSITGPTLYRVTNGGPTSVPLALDNPSQYDSISWRVDNTTVTGTGSTFILNAANTAYNLIGEHFVTVTVRKGGVPYNKTVSFKVEY